MSRLLAVLKSEPVALDASVSAVVALALGFGWITWTPEQAGLVLAAYKAVTAVVVRALVTPNANAVQQAAQAATAASAAKEKEIRVFLDGAKRRTPLHPPNRVNQIPVPPAD